MNTVLLIIMAISLLFICIYPVEVGIIKNRVLGYYTRAQIEENLAQVRDPLIFQYLLNFYLKNYYRIGKEKWYHEGYYIYCKGWTWVLDQRVPKWDLYTKSYYDWDQANTLLDKIREEKSQIIRENRKEALKGKVKRFFEEDNKILYK